MKKVKNMVATSANLATLKPCAPAAVATGASTSQVDLISTCAVEAYIQEHGLDSAKLRREAQEAEYIRACRALAHSVKQNYVQFCHWVDEMDSFATKEANKAIRKWRSDLLDKRHALRRYLERQGASREYIAETLQASFLEEASSEEEASRWIFAYRLAFAFLQAEDACDGWKRFILLHWVKKALNKGRKYPMEVKNYLWANSPRIGRELGLTTMETKATITNSEVRKLMKELR